MFDVIIIARKKSHLLLQTINSVIGSTDLQFNLIVMISELFPSVARNMALKKAQSRYVFFVNPDVFVHPGTFEFLLEKFAEADLVTIRSLLNQDTDDGLFGVDTFGIAPSYVQFDELYHGSRYATFDFFEQMRWLKHRIVETDREISHAPDKGGDELDQAYFATKWRSIKMGETTWLNPGKSY